MNNPKMLIAKTEVLMSVYLEDFHPDTAWILELSNKFMGLATPSINRTVMMANAICDGYSIVNFIEVVTVPLFYLFLLVSWWIFYLMIDSPLVTKSRLLLKLNVICVETTRHCCPWIDNSFDRGSSSLHPVLLHWLFHRLCNHSCYYPLHKPSIFLSNNQFLPFDLSYTDEC